MLPYIHNAEPIEPPSIQVANVTARSDRGANMVLKPQPHNGEQPPGAQVTVLLPPRIPAQCVDSSAADYRLNPMVLLAILKVESNGRTGIVSKNTNGTHDLGPAQFNTGTWGHMLESKYNISRASLINDMCQSVRAMAFAVRTEINQAGGDMWRGIGNYHSKTPRFHKIYVKKVLDAHRLMVKKGAF